MQEVVYNYYTDHYGGCMIPENEFPCVIRKAEAYMNLFATDGWKESPFENLVKNCLCDMAEAIYNVEKQYAEGIKKTENTDGYSVTWATEITEGQDQETTIRTKLYRIAECCLMHTGILYLGV